MITFQRTCIPLCLLLLAGCGKSTTHWIEQAKSADEATRLQAVHALEQRTREPTTVVPALIAALADENTYVRRDAARGLGRFGPAAKDAVPALQARLQDPQPSVRKSAAKALERIGPAASP